MCGIVGFIDFSRSKSSEALEGIVSDMAARLRHRGPDDGGVWADQNAGIALGHRRLSILDLSPQGRQPMSSSTGRYVISFNGEIYNFKDIRHELEQLGWSSWRGHSDTEVALAAIEQWGLRMAVERFTGMFAMALWDKKERVLSLARDRFGKKPLYYGWSRNQFIFGSELKALRRHPQFERNIDRNSLALYLRYNNVPAPYSIYQNTFKLPPASILKVSLQDRGRPKPIPYWSAVEVARRGLSAPINSPSGDVVGRLDELIKDAVKIRMVADVPLGAFLSGGIDSSTIVAAMQAQSTLPVKTFTIGFHESDYDEAVSAKAVANYLGTDHTELYVTSKEAQSVIEELPVIYDEPFSDSSQIPTFLVSQLARQRVTVCLSGDGGDELFGGYNRYFWGRDIWNAIGWMPPRYRAVMARALRMLSPMTWDRIWDLMDPLLPSRLKQRLPGDKIHKLSQIITAPTPDRMYHGFISYWKNPDSVVLDGREPNHFIGAQGRDIATFTERMMAHDTITYLPDDILVKLDRASMAVGLECRTPFLDPRVLDFAWKLPLALKTKGGEGKLVLKQVLSRYIPQKLIERPKMGFGVPIDAWLRGSLRPWAESLIDERRLLREGFFDPKPIREKWTEHISGRRNWQYLIWDILMFQSWLESERQRPSLASSAPSRLAPLAS